MMHKDGLVSLKMEECVFNVVSRSFECRAEGSSAHDSQLCPGADDVIFRSEFVVELRMPELISRVVCK